MNWENEYKSEIQRICVTYFRILKKCLHITQKEIAKEIGISDCLLSKWKKYQRKINSEYYNNIRQYFERKEFEKSFEKNYEVLTQNFVLYDEKVSQDTFWDRLFQKEFQREFKDAKWYLQAIQEILEARMEEETENIVKAVSFEKNIKDINCINLLTDQGAARLYCYKNDEILIEHREKSKIVSLNDLENIQRGHFFVYKLNEKVSEKMLLRANCYVEMILGCLKSNM